MVKVKGLEGVEVNNIGNALDVEIKPNSKTSSVFISFGSQTIYVSKCYDGIVYISCDKGKKYIHTERW